LTATGVCGTLPAVIRRVWACAAVALFGCGRDVSDGGFLDHLYVLSDGRFEQVSSFDTSGGNRDRLEIAVGDSAVLLDIEGPAVIRRIWITVSSGDRHYLRRIALKMYWDDEADPSVLAPLGDFFGNGFDKRHYTSLPLGVSSGGFYCYFPMPFAKRARIVVENGTGLPIDAFYYNIGIERVPRLAGDAATFHASWRRDVRTTDVMPHVALDARGRGSFVGLSLNAESYRGALDFLEGDEFLVVDGELRGQGTGTEDYFNAGWYFESGTFDAPFHGLVVKDVAKGRIAAYRWHLPDPIAFSRSLRVELEHGHANREVADYATVAYWYQVDPHDPLPPLPPAASRRVLGVKIPPAALGPASLVVKRSSAGVSIGTPVPRPDRYEVLVYPVAHPDAPRVSYRVGSRPAARVRLDTEEPGTVLDPVSLGEVTAETNIEVIGSPAAAPVPAAVHARPIRSWADEWNVVGPFPNPRVLGTEISLAVDSVYGPERDPSLQTRYRVMGGASVEWKRVSASDDGQVRLNSHFEPNDWVAAYAQAYLFSPSAREVSLLFGADDAHVLWVNGERVSERQGRHISRADELDVRVRLRAGWNPVLLKVADLDGGWAFQVRAADPDGELRWRAEPGR
jgi:hypothetical protein